jgi:hypothetical protein
MSAGQDLSAAGAHRASERGAGESHESREHLEAPGTVCCKCAWDGHRGVAPWRSGSVPLGLLVCRTVSDCLCVCVCPVKSCQLLGGVNHKFGGGQRMRKGRGGQDEVELAGAPFSRLFESVFHAEQPSQAEGQCKPSLSLSEGQM